MLHTARTTRISSAPARPPHLPHDCRRALALLLALCLAVCAGACGSAHNTSARTAPSNSASTASGEVSVAMQPYVAEQMVLQRDAPITLSGLIARQDGEVDASAITVTLTGDGTRRAGKATVKDNRFTATLDALPASETPYELTVAYGDQTVFHLNTVYIGDVFVASGQSNMELNYEQYYGTTAEARKNLGSAFSLSDLPELVDDPGIHFIRAAHTTDSADFPVDPVMGGEWKACTGTDAQYLGYLPQLFAQQLREDEPHVPIGIIQTAWGGTPIRDHVPDGRIYKNHIAPLRGMHIAGVIWYQGCNDAWQLQNALDYEARFSTLINDYRTVFEDPQMPFLYVQLARWGGAQYTQYVRQAQLDTLTDPNLKNTANLGMTVTIDTDKGTSSVIHPLGKDIIAARMADQWRAIRAHKAIPSSPLAATARRTDDGTVQLAFRNGTAQGLRAMKPDYSLSASAAAVATATSQPVEGFEVADASGEFHKATASINGDTVILRCPQVRAISQVRYLWAGEPHSDSLLYNASALPASPFILAVSR
ncbi:Sialic acid-specific 9-O-acetylesterase [Bifidobacterium pseudolongum subsp. globosum]|nr:Sialic acid-specific 9-O-acetylesterase [Bifidobacterium pseudolongum subsp. globosum]RYQ08058.1 Sialic acid-specific 9-O-acetylesterase [Bifidobacterium pseudolongum subsp. globosum]RYQ12209.1 Sialic acid-specific 9-O-acetylesterase [Bifidobacterium pseudolongum subsp. globosum]RYQ14685.1 Sialic acid-specific 9-O-acetylesterase [Bifidobacterium pseudolongum subsp. globosum]